MDFFEVIKSRRSVRNYKDNPIAKDLIEKLIDSARYSPTARNIQPWRFVVITNKETIANISELAPNGKFMIEAPACIAVFCEDTKYYLEDGSAATTNILNAAAALGIGACWIAGDKKDYCQAVAEMVNAPKEYKLVSLISLGQAAQALEAKEKKACNELIFWENF